MGRYGDAVWYPPDPDEPTSELYRLIPPRRQRAARTRDLGGALNAVRVSGSVREALDAATGMVPAPADSAVSCGRVPRRRVTGNGYEERAALCAG